MKNSEHERMEFSQRLQTALSKAGYAPDSPTQLARAFNARSQNRPVTVHAARKWLVGEAIPTQEKLRLLSDWLNVSTEWLRFGDGQQTLHDPETTENISVVNRVEKAILKNLPKLSIEQKQIILAVALGFVKANNLVSKKN